MSTTLKAAGISPLVICVAAPFYAAWLYWQMTSVVPTTPAHFALVARIASTSAALFLPLAYLLVFTYGQLFLKWATPRGWTGPLHHLVAGGAPGLLALALPLAIAITEVTSMGNIVLPIAFAFGLLGALLARGAGRAAGASTPDVAVA